VYSETEEKIFQAAIEEFAERGKDGARLQGIADRAGINKALVHYYFRSKDRLYSSVFEHLIRKYLSSLGDSVVDASDYKTTLKRFIDSFVDLIEQRPDIPRFMLKELSSGSQIFRDKFRELIADGSFRTPENMIRQYRNGVESGEIRDLDAVQTMVSLLGAIVYLYAAFPVVSLLRPEIAEHRPEFIKQRKEHLFELFYNGLKPRPESAS
jgi:TetR/AcrR family transcriptional regulator